MEKLEKNPPKGTSDWLPDEFKKRKYIFDTFRKVCESFGYEEYLTPTFEKANIYKIKSGEDIGGKELMNFKDKAGREFALRPEMTPSIMRLITKIYDQEQKPIRYFSIANFFRNEKPQRGRNREFWQVNYDIFGSTSIYADIEIIKIAIETMLAFIPKEKLKQKPFVTYINDRDIITYLLEKKLNIKNNITEIVRILDKKDKLSQEDFNKRLKEYKLDEKQIEKINEFLNSDLDINSIDKYIDPSITVNLKKVFEELKKTGYTDWIQFKPSLIRGFDYYTGIVYEVFDTSGENTRSLFGGGRYDKLGEIFGKKNIPAVGCAPGDEGIKLFLETWKLFEIMPEKKESFYLPIIDNEAKDILNKLAFKLRKDGNRVLQGLEKQPISKALEFANKKNIDKVILIGSDELKEQKYLEKDMNNGKQIVKNI